MKTSNKAIVATISLFALANCATEAGSDLDEGGFGNPTMNNIGVHSGDQSFAISMTRKFQADVPSVVNFAFNRADLDSEAKMVLNRQADWIKQFPEVRFRVFGHTDLVGSDAYNKALGQRRAQAAVNYLVAQGIDRRRLEAVASFGETQPLVASQDRERLNRRAVTEVSGLAKRRSGPLNGKYAQVIWREYVRSAREIPPEFQQEATDG